jgi:hypothetical protein
MDEVVIKVEVNAVRLQQVVLCADCDVITDSPHDICLVCGSHSLLTLSRVLGKVSTVSVLAARRKPDILAASAKRFHSADQMEGKLCRCGSAGAM